MTRRLAVAALTMVTLAAGLAVLTAPVWVCLVGAGWVGLFLVPYVVTGVRV